MGERRMYKAHKDNCLQCCLCYLMDKDIDDILDVSGMPPQFHDHWFNFLNEFLHEKYDTILAPMAEGQKVATEGIGIYQGLTKDSTHAVVIDNEDKILWDPNPQAPVYGALIMRLVIL